AASGSTGWIMTGSLNISGNGYPTGYAVTASACDRLPIADPATPAVGNFDTYVATRAARPLLFGLDSFGAGSPYQPSLYKNNVSVIMAGSSLGSGSTSINKPIT